MIKGFPDLPPIWWLASIALIYLFEYLFPGLHIAGRGFDVIAWALLAVALALVLWSAFWFWRKRTTIEPHCAPKVLIVEGPYRLSRNPIYLAFILLTLGASFGHGSGFGLVVTFGLWRVLQARFVLPEEAGLRAAFGPEAEAYLRATRRWL